MHMKLTATQIDYHRNGISGKGFYVVVFDYEYTDRDGSHTEIGKNMVAIRPAGSSKDECYVLNADMLAAGNIGFAEGNSWRGDMYVDAIDEAIAEHEKKSMAQLRKERKEREKKK